MRTEECQGPVTFHTATHATSLGVGKKKKDIKSKKGKILRD